MNRSGTSLMPAAMPVAAPFHGRRSGWHRSQTTRAISTSSTWPRKSARCTGSVHSSSPDSSMVAPSRDVFSQPSWRNAIQIVATSANSDTTVTIAISPVNGSASPAAKTSAANGV